MSATQHWYVTTSDRIDGRLDYCTFSQVIEEHPATWAARENRDLVFVMSMPPEDDDDATPKLPTAPGWYWLLRRCSPWRTAKVELNARNPAGGQYAGLTYDGWRVTDDRFRWGPRIPDPPSRTD